MSCVDAEFVDEAADHVGEIAERIVVGDAFDRPAVAGHVGHDDSEMRCEGFDIPRVVRQTRRTGSSAMQQDDRGPAAGFGDENRFTRDGDGALAQVGGGHAETPVRIGGGTRKFGKTCRR